LARHDRCGGSADAVCRRADQRDFVLEAHGFLRPWSLFLVGPIVWPGAGESITARSELPHRVLDRQEYVVPADGFEQARTGRLILGPFLRQPGNGDDNALRLE